MAAVLALAAAVLYGSADFLGGVGSRRATALSFLAVSAPVGAVIMLVAALAAGGPVTAGHLGRGLAAPQPRSCWPPPPGAVTARSCPGPAGRGLAGMALAAGAGDVAASLLYVLAVRSGPFALAAVITALYPAVTVLLARRVLGERMRAVQRTGLALGALGIILATA